MRKFVLALCLFTTTTFAQDLPIIAVGYNPASGSVGRVFRQQEELTNLGIEQGVHQSGDHYIYYGEAHHRVVWVSDLSYASITLNDLTDFSIGHYKIVERFAPATNTFTFSIDVGEGSHRYVVDSFLSTVSEDQALLLVILKHIQSTQSSPAIETAIRELELRIRARGILLSWVDNFTHLEQITLSNDLHHDVFSSIYTDILRILELDPAGAVRNLTALIQAGDHRVEGKSMLRSIEYLTPISYFRGLRTGWVGTVLEPDEDEE